MRESGRQKLAWRVPGTEESGKHAMYTRRFFDILLELGNKVCNDLEKEAQKQGIAKPLHAKFQNWNVIVSDGSFSCVYTGTHNSGDIIQFVRAWGMGDVV